MKTQGVCSYLFLFSLGHHRPTHACDALIDDLSERRHDPLGLFTVETLFDEFIDEPVGIKMVIPGDGASVE